MVYIKPTLCIIILFNRVLNLYLMDFFCRIFFVSVENVSEFCMLIFNLEILLNTLISERALVKSLELPMYKILVSSIKVNLIFHSNFGWFICLLCLGSLAEISSPMLNGRVKTFLSGLAPDSRKTSKFSPSRRTSVVGF